MPEDEIKGLGTEPQSNWPTKQNYSQPAIERLAETQLHTRVLTYLLERLTASENAMANFYPRWQWNEKRIQAYIDLPKYEKLLKEASASGEPPNATAIVIPYAFATQATIVTYLIQAFAGRKPIFQLSTYNKDQVDAARKMELLLQYNADHTRLVKHLFQHFADGELYGVGVMRTMWRTERKKRSKVVMAPKQGWLKLFGGNGPQRSRETVTTFEGSQVCAQDPFMFFPDPRVPMHEVSRRGEYVFWRTFEGMHFLKKEEAENRVKWVDKIPANASMSKGDLTGSGSSRGLLAQGEAHPGAYGSTSQGANYVQIDQGTIDIIPSELGLGESKQVERWIFSIANKGQIIQAEPLDLDHGMHPIVVSEPYTMGYGFGQPGLSDYLGPIQDAVSWFLNSHMYNVRTALNNVFIVDPSQIEMQDLKKPGPGKFIRMKRNAYGRDVRQALTQLPVADVTRGHVSDLDLFMKLGDALAAVNDNLRGLQDSGGRKSATEARTSAEAAASRLASHAKLISSQSMIDLAEQMTLNYQQFLSDEFIISVLGSDAQMGAMTIRPQDISGDFVFPVNDGTLPVDKVALLDVWKEVFMAVAQDQELRTQYNMPKLFEYVAELGGAKNIQSMRAMPDEILQKELQKGNLAPIREVLPQGGAPTPTPGMEGTSPANRISGALG